VAKRPRNRGSAGRARAGAATADQAGAGSAGGAQPGTAQLTAPAADADADYPGKRFGLPEQGPRSVASMGRRILALIIDWLLSMVIAIWLTHSQYWTIVVFAVEVYVLTALTGTTVGKRLVGIRVIRTGGGPVGFRWALVRTVLLLTVILPLLTDYDRRGVHDRAADTIVVRI
jgi:RDD family